MDYLYDFSSVYAPDIVFLMVFVAVVSIVFLFSRRLSMRGLVLVFILLMLSLSIVFSSRFLVPVGYSIDPVNGSAAPIYQANKFSTVYIMLFFFTTVVFVSLFIMKALGVEPP